MPLDFQLLPGPQKYAKSWSFWFLLEGLGHDFTYFWGPGDHHAKPAGQAWSAFQA